MGDQSQADLGEAVDDLSAGLLSVVGAPADISATVVELCNINKSFGSLHVIRDVSLSVQKGECVCIVGPSGSGKTTLIRCINALEAIQGGTIVVNGHSLGFQQRNGKTRKATESELARQRQEIGMVFQRFNLFPHLTALENITCGPIRVRGTPQKEAEAVARKLLGRVGLGHKANAYPSQLSGGQQQRVAICRALSMQPRVMLFDEATSALDPEMVGEVLDVIRELKREGMTMIIVTHEMKFAMHTADRVIMMDGGVIIENLPPDKFFAADDARDARVTKFLGKVL